MTPTATVDVDLAEAWAKAQATRSKYVFPNTTEGNPGWLSPSQVTEYLSCPSCYELGRIRKLPRPLGVNLPIGAALHRAVEQARLSDRRGANGKLLPQAIEEAIQIAAEHFDTECSQPADVETGAEIMEIDLGSKFSNLGEAKDLAISLARFTIPSILELDAKRGKVAAVEFNLSMLPSPWPFVVQGRLDVLYCDWLADTAKPDQATLMADLKSSSTQSAPDELVAIAQTMYSLFWTSRNLPLVVMADVVSKTKHPELRSYSLEADDYSRDLTYKTVLDVAESISAGRFPPRPGYRCNYLHGFSNFALTANGRFPE